MNEKQKAKRNFRSTKVWKEFRKKMFKNCNGVDLITGHKLRKGYQLHHRNLDETQYQNLREDWFICINNQTHDFLHWLFRYYPKDPAIIDRIKAEMERMKEINSVDNKQSKC